MVVAIDCESFATDTSPQRLVSVAFASRQSGVQLFSSAHDAFISELIRDALREGAAFAFAPGDLCMILKRYPELFNDVVEALAFGRIYDVLTREKKIDIAEGFLKFRGGYGLDEVCQRRAGFPIPKSELAAGPLARIGIQCPPDLEIRRAYGYVAHLPVIQYPWEFQKYAMLDPYGTLLTYEKQEEFRAAHTHDVFRCSPIEAMGHFVLNLQTIRGINVDRAWVTALARGIEAKIAELSQVLIYYGLARVEKGRVIKNEGAARAMMEATGKGKPTPSGKSVKIDSDSLNEAMLPAGHPLRIYGDLATLQSTASKNLRPLSMFDIVRTKYDECVSTGRTSSSAPAGLGDGTNFQNFPRPPQKAGEDPVRDLMGRFRGALIPPPGYVFGISDLTGIELATFADTEILWLGDSKLGEAINSGINAHTLFACDLLGIDYSQYDKKNPEHADARQVSKIKNFGSLGGMGPPSFQRHLYREIGVLQPMQLVRQQHQMWLRRWRTQRYFDYIKQQAGPDGFITLVEPRTGFIRGRMRYTEACNFPFQSKAAIVAKLGLWWLWLASLDRNSPLFGCWQCIFVHDENVSCFPKSIAEEALKEQNRIMTLAARTVCPTIAITVEGHNEERYGK